MPSTKTDPTSPPEVRLSIRADQKQKHLLRRAAEARNTTVSQFVLEASLREADRVLQDETILRVSEEEYAHLCRLMDAPARDLPALRALVKERAPWDE